MTDSIFMELTVKAVQASRPAKEYKYLEMLERIHDIQKAIKQRIKLHSLLPSLHFISLKLTSLVSFLFLYRSGWFHYSSILI